MPISVFGKKLKHISGSLEEFTYVWQETPLGWGVTVEAVWISSNLTT